MTARPDGLFQVDVDGGPDQITHGPDPLIFRQALQDPTLVVGAPAAVPERAPICAADHVQRIFYARQMTAPDRSVQLRSTIQALVRQMNARLSAESVASGGPTADYRVLCDSSGAIRVDTLVTSSSDFSAIAGAANAFLGTAESNRVDRTIFFDGQLNNACGLGSYIPDERPDATNPNNEGGSTAIIYQPCWYGEVAMHENGHNQGAVQPDSPNSTGSGAHCYDEEDVMCYSPDGGNRNQSGTVDRCGSGEARFDCGFDDYFDAAPAAGSYLSTHWNIGSRVNNFIEFGFGTQPLVNLKRGIAKSAYSGREGSWRYFRVRVPRRARNLIVTVEGCRTSGCQPNLNLYLRSRARPSLSSYHRRSQSSTSVERTRVRRPRRGSWFAGVHVRSGTDPARFRIRATYRR